jgi:hypothetical protein
VSSNFALVCLIFSLITLSSLVRVFPFLFLWGHDIENEQERDTWDTMCQKICFHSNRCPKVKIIMVLWTTCVQKVTVKRNLKSMHIPLQATLTNIIHLYMFILFFIFLTTVWNILKKKTKKP